MAFVHCAGCLGQAPVESLCYLGFGSGMQPRSMFVRAGGVADYDDSCFDYRSSRPFRVPRLPVHRKA